MAADQNGSPRREHYRALAKQGNAAAIRKLKGPGECPDVLAHVRDWLYQLYGRSGVGGMGETAPLSWQEIRAWAEFHGIRPTPDELDALMLLDNVLRRAASDERAKSAPAQQKNARGRD